MKCFLLFQVFSHPLPSDQLRSKLCSSFAKSTVYGWPISSQTKLEWMTTLGDCIDFDIWHQCITQSIALHSWIPKITTDSLFHRKRFSNSAAHLKSDFLFILRQNIIHKVFGRHMQKSGRIKNKFKRKYYFVNINCA